MTLVVVLVCQLCLVVVYQLCLVVARFARRTIYKECKNHLLFGPGVPRTSTSIKNLPTHFAENSSEEEFTLFHARNSLAPIRPGCALSSPQSKSQNSPPEFCAQPLKFSLNDASAHRCMTRPETYVRTHIQTGRVNEAGTWLDCYQGVTSILQPSRHRPATILPCRHFGIKRTSVALCALQWPCAMSYPTTDEVRRHPQVRRLHMSSEEQSDLERTVCGAADALLLLQDSI